MFKNSKYGKFLTVLLIIVIIVIVGLIGFLGYDLIKNIFIDNDAKDAVEQFESSRVNRVQRPQNETTQTNEIVAPPTVENTPTPGDTFFAASSSKKYTPALSSIPISPHPKSKPPATMYSPLSFLFERTFLPVKPT